MQQTFGVKLLFEEDDEEVVDYQGMLEEVTINTNFLYAGEPSECKYIIAPASLSIFEPQVADLGCAWTGGHWSYFIYTDSNVFKGWIPLDDNIHIVSQDEIKIIRRNNKPFFTPLEEKLERKTV